MAVKQIETEMTAMELVRWVVANHQYRKFKPHETERSKVWALNYDDDVDEIGEDDEENTRAVSSRKGYTLLDGWTAQHVLQVYEACNEANKTKLDGFSLLGLVNSTWRVLEKVGV